MEAEVEKGVVACLALKGEKSDPLHWGSIDCSGITPPEAVLIAKFDSLKKNFSGKENEKLLFSLDNEARKLLETTGSPVAEVLINEIVALHYAQKYKHRNN